LSSIKIINNFFVFQGAEYGIEHQYVLQIFLVAAVIAVNPVFQLSAEGFENCSYFSLSSFNMLCRLLLILLLMFLAISFN